MFPPFPQEKAFEYCKQTIEQIKNDEYKIVRVTEESEERSQNGFMIGCLICLNNENQEVVLKTISGIANRLEKTQNCRLDDNSIWVEPIVSNQEIHKAYEKNDIEIHKLTDLINEATKSEESKIENQNQIKEWKNLRTKLCTESLLAIHKLYNFHCADGKVKTLDDVRKERNRKELTQTGTGECCAPKLLNYAFSHDLHPISMAECYYQLNNFSLQITPQPPCDSRCGVLLPSMLGIEILYRDEHICVVNKQSGVLSVPGRLPENKDSIVSRFRTLFPNAIEQCAAHRLDQETSGIMILVFTKDALRNLTRQFEFKVVQKEYIALVDGILPKMGIPEEGQNELYFRVDLDNRPHQMWDEVYGKKAITQWKILRVEKYKAPDGTMRDVTRVLFIPHTGRTHQLRLCAADSHGFGVPIIGDSLYGKRAEGERLKLHARYIKFYHPITNEIMEFVNEPEF